MTLYLSKTDYLSKTLTFLSTLTSSKNLSQFKEHTCLIYGTTGESFTFVRVELTVRKVAAGLHNLCIPQSHVILHLLLSPHAFADDLHRKRHNIDGPIKTIVVIVMENRSFNHVLGWLKSTRPEIDGLTGKESNRISVSDPSSPEIEVSDDAHSGKSTYLLPSSRQ